MNIFTKKELTSHRTVLRVDDDVEFVLNSKVPDSLNTAYAIPAEKSIQQSRKTYSKVNPLTFVQRAISKEVGLHEEKCVSPIRKPETVLSIRNVKTRNTSLNVARKNAAFQNTQKKRRRGKKIGQVQAKKKLKLNDGLQGSINSRKNTKKTDKVSCELSKCKPISKILKNNVIKKEIDPIEVKSDFSNKKFLPSPSSSSQFNTSSIMNLELKNKLHNNLGSKKFEIKKIKREHFGNSQPFYDSNNEVLIVNGTDTAPNMPADTIFRNVGEGKNAQSSFKFPSPAKCLSPRGLSSPNKTVTNFESKLRSPVKEMKESNLPENCSIIAKPKQRRKRELNSLFQNLKEISWAQDSSFQSLLCDTHLRHSERVVAKTNIRKLRQKPDQVKKVMISRTIISKKRRNKPNAALNIKKKTVAALKNVILPEVIPLNAALKVRSKKLSKMPKNKTVPKNKTSLKNKTTPKNKLRSMRASQTAFKSLNKVQEVITLSDDSESPSPETTPKEVNVPFKQEKESTPEVVQCSSSTSSDSKGKRRKFPNNKNLSLFNGVNIFQSFLGSRSNNRMYSSFQRPPECRVTLEPLEKTELWSSDSYLQNAMHNEYETFRKNVIEQAMLKVFHGVNDGPIISMFRDLQENLSSSSNNIKTTKKRKAEEESVRSSVRQSECAFRYKEIVVKKHENYIQVVLVPNTNKQNSLTIEAMKELKEAFLSAKKDINCRAVLINSSGSFFCSGLDLGQLMGANKKQVAEEMAVTLRDLILTLGLFTKPVVAAVNGAAIGFGVSLLTFCDIVLASDKATFCIPAAKLGYVPEGAVTLTLPQVVGSGVAIEMLLQGRRLTAQQALRYGLVSEVLWPTQLMEEVIPRIQSLVSQPLQVMEAIKTMVRCHLWEKLALHAQQEWRLLPSQWLEPSCQHNIKKLLQTGWSSD